MERIYVRRVSIGLVLDVAGEITPTHIKCAFTERSVWWSGYEAMSCTDESD